MKRTCLILIFLFLYVPASLCQRMEVPVDVQVPILLKILTFDRNLKKRAGDKLTIGIVYQEKFRISVNVRDRFVDVINESSIKKVSDIPIELTLVDIDKTDLESTAGKNGVDVLYVAPLRAMDMERITKVCRNNKITTMTGVLEYIDSGLAIGVGIKGRKPLIIINLPASKMEGADFSSQLLKLAKVIME